MVLGDLPIFWKNPSDLWDFIINPYRLGVAIFYFLPVIRVVLSRRLTVTVLRKWA